MRSRENYAARTLALLLACLLLPLAALAAINATSGRELAYRFILEQHGVSADELNFYQSARDGDKQSWRFSFLLKEKQEETDGLFIVDLYNDGSLKELTPPRVMHLDERLRRDFNDARPLPYTNESLLKLKEKWAPHLPGMLSELKAQHPDVYEQSGEYASIRALSQDYREPAPGALGLEQVEALAVQAILDSPPWTAERFAFFVPWLAAHYVSGELGIPVWHFIYHDERSNSPRFAGKSNEAYEREYWQPLIQAFGGQENTPLYVSLRLDASTGEVLDGVNTHFRPPQVWFVLGNIK